MRPEHIRTPRPPYAADMGFFEKAGLNVQVQTFSSGAEAAEAVIGGSPDLAITTPLLLANGYLRGLPFAIVAAGPIATTKSPSTLLCVAANGPIHSAQDLIGQTVGLNVLNTVLALSLDAYLASAMQKGSIRSLANPNIYIAPRFLLGAWFTSRQFAQRQMVRATFADHMDPTDIQALLDAAVRYGVLSKHLRATDLIVS